MLGLLCGSALAAETVEPPVLTRIRQTAEPLRSNVTQIIRARLSATVCGVDRPHRSMVLRDESSLLWLETEALPAEVEPGAQVLVEGALALGGGHAFLGRSPVVQSTDLQGPSQQTGRLHLEPGKHAFQLEYFQGRGPRLLEVRYAGPDISRTNIPVAELSYSRPETPGQFFPGLHYDYYEGEWTEFPELKALKPVASGQSADFTVEVGRRQTNFALCFTGFLEVPGAGTYEFSIRAGDSARLWIAYNSESRIQVTGHMELPEPTRLLPGQSWGRLREPAWVEAEGTVKQVGEHDGHLLLELSAETGRMQVLVADGDADAREMLLNNQVRITGLGRGAGTPHGSKVAGQLLAPSMREIAFLQAAEVNWQTWPVRSIASLSSQGISNFPPRLVHLHGTVTEVVPGASLRLRDESGLIEVLTSRASLDDRQTTMDVLGQATRAETNLFVKYAVCRQLDATNATRRLVTLTTVEQIRRLKLEEAALKYPVHFKGVVTFVFQGGLRAQVQGETEGIYVAATKSVSQPLRVGDLCEFEGYVSGITISPMVAYQRFTVLGPGQVPEPLHPTYNQLFTGALDAQWVEVQGVVLRVKGSDLVLGMRGGEMTARLFHGDPEELLQYVGSIVRVRGTVRTFLNSQHQVRSVIVQVTSPLELAMDSAPLADPFTAPAKSVAELRLFDPNATSVHLVKTSGQFLQNRGTTAFLMDGTNGLRVSLRERTSLAPGDLVEAIGIPENDGVLPVLSQALMRAVGHAALPEPRMLPPEELANSVYDSTLVQVQGILINFSTNQAEQVFEIQCGTSVCVASLARKSGIHTDIPIGSTVQITGVYSSPIAAAAGSRRAAQSPELLMNSAASLEVLASPTWWTARHAALVLGAMGFGLLGAVSWITALRRRVEHRTCQLREEIAGHRCTEAHLSEQTQKLQAEVEERKRAQLEIERIHRQLLETSRQAGQAEVAASVLHNVGNVLNSVNVSTSVITERLRNLRIATLAKAAEMMQQHSADLPSFLTQDEKGRRLPEYLLQLSGHLAQEQQQLLAELHGLGQNVEHIKEIVAMQQAYAKPVGILETAAAPELVESALRMHVTGFARHSIQLSRQFEDVPALTVDKHKVLQILINLLRNAKYACDESQQTGKKNVTVRIRRQGEDRVCIDVADNGVGIPPENMTRIFSHGFTTRKDGHGFGLHSSALAAREMDGTLTAHSEGPGKGATFTLDLPVLQSTTQPPPGQKAS